MGELVVRSVKSTHNHVINLNIQTETGVHEIKVKKNLIRGWDTSAVAGRCAGRMQARRTCRTA
ncbi:MAG: hypothetical protein ABSF34_16660, partial [Verrucomicrobiota bacterium]